MIILDLFVYLRWLDKNDKNIPQMMVDYDGRIRKKAKAPRISHVFSSHQTKIGSPTWNIPVLGSTWMIPEQFWDRNDASYDIHPPNKN